MCEKGPFGCRCQDLAHHVVGDGCSECNPDMAEWYEKEAEIDEKISEILLRPYTWAFTLEEDLRFSARILEFPGCFAEGKSLVDAHMALNRAAEAWLLSCLETGQPIPDPERWKEE